VKPLGGTHLLMQVLISRIRLGGVLIFLLGVMVLRQVLNFQPLDILPHQQGFIYLKKEYLENGSVKVTFHFFDQSIHVSEPIIKSAYLQAKFGNAYKRIVEQIGDFISCETSFFPNSAVAVLFKTGELHIFTANGSSVLKCELLYQESPVQCPAVEEKNIWCVVPEKNSVINYSPGEQSVLLRIGGGKSSAFDCPVSLTKVLNKLYICNRNNYKIRTILLEDYSVKDYREFNEPIYKYFQVYDKEYAVLDSGVYML
jgi:hypothetical protein